MVISSNPSSQVAPSAEPTAQPTPYDHTAQPSAQLTNAVSSSASLWLQYNTFTAKDEILVGGCLSWMQFVNRLLSIENQHVSPLMFEFKTVSNVFLSNFNVVQCLSSSKSMEIIQSLSSSTSAASETVCGNSTWKVQRCDGDIPALCVDCDDPCTDVGDESYSYVIGCNAGSSMRMSTVRISISDNAPQLKISKLVALDTSIQFVVESSSPGIVRCAAFESDALQDLQLSTDLIDFYSAPIIVSTPHLNNSITIKSLLASSEYSAFCYSTHAEGSRCQHLN